MNESLFEPSLQQVRSERPLYSTTTLFLSAFFGGPVAGVIVFAVNASRAARFTRDAGWVALALVVALAAPFLVLGLMAEAGANAGRIVMRVFSLLLAGGLYLRHRQIYRGQDLFGVSRPNGWPLGLAAIAIAFVMSLLSMSLMQALLAAAGERA